MLAKNFFVFEIKIYIFIYFVQVLYYICYNPAHGISLLFVFAFQTTFFYATVEKFKFCNVQKFRKIVLKQKIGFYHEYDDNITYKRAFAL